MVSKDKNIHNILVELSRIAQVGPIPSIATGQGAIGLTLQNALDIKRNSGSKSTFHGIVINASRRYANGIRNRINLFAQVPDWENSKCKSSKEIINLYGYDISDNRKRLYCTLSTRIMNSQGLVLVVNHADNSLIEMYVKGGSSDPVVIWKIDKLVARLIESHSESMWVNATTHLIGGKQYFHFKEVVFYGEPNIIIFPDLISAGTITIDHLIEYYDEKAHEKGPLFKIHPKNLVSLFPKYQVYNLMDYSH